MPGFGILEVHFFGLFHQRIYDVALPSLFDLAAHEVIHLFPALVVAQRRAHRAPSRRQFVHDRYIEIAVERHRERARNRRGGHEQHVWARTHFKHAGALHDSEPVLFVDDSQTQPPERYILLDERMGADSNACLPFRDIRKNLFAFRLGQSPDKQAYPHAQRVEVLAQIGVMLLRQNFRRRHERALVAAIQRMKHRRNGDNGLAAPYIAL